MADDTHSRFATVSHLWFKIIVVGHTTKHMTHSRSWDVPLTTVHHLYNVNISIYITVRLDLVKKDNVIITLNRFQPGPDSG